MTEPSKADLLRRDLKHASDRRERATELESFAEWIRLSDRDAKPLAFEVPKHKSGITLMLHSKRSLELTDKQSSELQAWLRAEVRHLRKYADGIEQNLKI